MGASIDSLGTAFDVTKENPAFVVVSFLVGLVGGLAAVVLSFVPLVGPVMNNIVVWPAMLCFLLGMAFAGLARETASPRAGIQSLKSNYVSLAGAYGLLFVGSIVVGIVLAFILVLVALVVGIGSVATDVTSPEAAMGMGLVGGGVGLVLALLLIVATTVVGFVIQFLDAAVVVGGESATSSFSAAWETFRSDPVSVFGYTLVRASMVIGVYVVVYTLYSVGSSVDTTTGLALAGAGGLLIGSFVGAFLLSYHVAYYDARMGNRTEAA